MDVEENTSAAVERQSHTRGNFLEVLRVFAWLGSTSFGGPIAHLGYFRAEIVNRRKWLDEHSFAEIIALCQFLPGPTSSQVGIALGITRAGLAGGLAAWLGFTLPSACALTIFAYIVRLTGTALDTGWANGLLIVAVAVVTQAVWGMAITLCPDRPRITLALLVAAISVVWTAPFAPLVLLALAGLVGWRWLRSAETQSSPYLPLAVPRAFALCCLVCFFALLAGLPLLRLVVHSQALALFDTFFRVGSFVFGGGHVVLPLLQREVVPAGWVSNDHFLIGYAATQAVPGPLFTFSAYLGAVSQPSPNGWSGALIALLAIFLPSFLLVIGLLPFWNILRTREIFQATLRGVNAAVVGILLAALYQPIITSAIHAPIDMALALLDFALLVIWKLPPWVVVLLSVTAGILLHLFHIYT